MKKMYLCAMITLSMAVQSFSQQHSNSQDVLQVKVYDNDGKLTTDKKLSGLDASELDLEALVNQQKDGRVTLYGTYTSNNVKHFVYHNSKEASALLCKKEVMSFKPQFGISGYSNDNFTGFVVKTVLAESPAEQLGLIAGDVVYNIGEYEITSFCDLYMAVAATKVGEEVNVEYSTKGRMVNSNATIAGKPLVNVTFESCELKTAEINTDLASAEEIIDTKLTVYPNPTKEVTYLKYESTSDEPISYYVMNSTGALIHQENITTFHGSLRTSFTFDKQAAGTYYFVVEQGNKIEKSKVLFIGN